MNEPEYEPRTDEPVHSLVESDGPRNECSVYVLAGGAGVRMRGFQEDNPKLLVKMPGVHADGEETFLDHALSSLADVGVGAVRLLTSRSNDSGRDEIMQSARARSRELGIRVDESLEETSLGTGGAVLNALLDERNSTVLVVLPDTDFPYEQLPAMLERHTSIDAAMTLAVTSQPGDGAQNESRILVNSTGLIVQSIEGAEKEPPSQLIYDQAMTSAGFVVIDTDRFLNALEAYGEYGIRELDLHRQVLNMLIRGGERVAFHDIGVPAPDLGDPTRYYRYQEALARLPLSDEV
jgi:NDP-sugar pyrophosphorylase family protein